MNIYKKYCPNVFIAQCDEEYKKGDVITLETKYGDEHECIVHNKVGEKGGFFYYSITREDGFNCQERAKNKAERLLGWSTAAIKRANVWSEKSQEGAAFLALGEPIKVGHHSERAHRALLDRNWNRIGKSVEEQDKAVNYEERARYWEQMAKKVNLSMPESIDVFSAQLIDAKAYHEGMKKGTIKRSHSFSLTYAKKAVNDLTKKVVIAKILWGDENED